MIILQVTARVVLHGSRAAAVRGMPQCMVNRVRPKMFIFFFCLNASMHEYIIARSIDLADGNRVYVRGIF